MTYEYIFKHNGRQDEVISAVYGFVVLQGDIVGEVINVVVQNLSSVAPVKSEMIKNSLDYWLTRRILPEDFETQIIDPLTVKLTLYNDYQLGFYSGTDFVPDYNTLVYSGYIPGFLNQENNNLYSNFNERFVDVRSTVNNGGTTNNQGTFDIPSFNGNGYKVNNDIIITIPKEEGKNITKCELVVNNNYFIGARTSGLLVYYANNNEIKIPFHQIAKVMMSEPEFNNDYTTIDQNPYMYGQFLDCGIEIKRFYTVGNSNIELFDTYRSNKKFLRAGERVNKTNISTQPNRLLKVTDKIPIWEGLPSPFYFVNELYHVERVNRMLPDVPIERMQTNDCDIYYLEFANQEGGYSYWLFRSAKNSRSTTNQGYSNIYGKVNNFGNNENITHELISKVPARYMPLMHDLAVSPKVRIYNGGNSWTEIIQRGNTLPYATDKRVYDVSFKFEIPTNFNPKITW